MFNVYASSRDRGGFVTLAENMTRRQASALRKAFHEDKSNEGATSMLYRNDGRFINSRDK